MGIVLSTSISVVVEVQALWVAVFLTGLASDTADKTISANKQPLRINTISQRQLDQSTSEDVVWGNITGGGLAIDTIHCNDMLMRDLSLSPHRMGGDSWSEMSAVYGPSAYAETVDEGREMREMRARR